MIERGRPGAWLTNPYVVLCLSMAVGSGTLVVGRSLVGEVPPVALAFLRWAVALTVLVPLGFVPLLRQRRILMRHWPLLLGMGATACSTHHVFLFMGLETTTALNASIELGGMPIATIALVLLLTRERVGWRVLVGMALGFGGVALVIARGDPLALLRLDVQVGDGFVILSVLSWGLYSVLLGRLPPGVDSRGLLLAIASIGFAMMFPAYLIEAASGAGVVFSTGAIVGILYAGLFPSVIGFALWQYGAIRIGPSAASQFTYLGPVFSSFWSIVLLDERLEAHHAAILLVFLGIYVANRTPRPPAPVSR
jgi:drug/metabolite transporter (DMT)-like permease